MRDDAKMKEITKVARPRSLWAGEQKFLLIMPEGSRGHFKPNFFERLEKNSAPNGAIKVERRPKEDERVVRGHFHDRVGESPARCGRFGTSGSSLARLLSEISQFENCYSVGSNL